MDNRALNRDFGSQNRAQKQKKDFSEEELRRDVESNLGKDYVDKILKFAELDPPIFIDINSKIRKFIESLTRSKSITSTKMRKIYELIKNSDDLNQMLLKIPYLAYMVGRENSMEAKRNLGKIYIIFKDTIEKAESYNHISNIKKFAEALVAYQKYYEKDREGE